MEDNVFDRKYSSLSKRFIIISVVFVLMFLFKQGLIHYQIEQEKQAAYIINIAGRQRMLGQKIVKELMIIDDYTDMDSLYQERIAKLQESMDLMQRIHSELFDINAQERFVKQSSEVTRLCDEFEPGYQAFVSVVNQMILILEESSVHITEDSETWSLLMEEVIWQSDDILVQMDQIVSAYETAERAALDRIQLIHGVLLGGLVLILIFIAGYIFIPLIRYLKKSYQSINDINGNMIRIFNAMKGAIFVVRRDGEILFANSEAIRYQRVEDNLQQISPNIAHKVNWLNIHILRTLSKALDTGEGIEDLEVVVEDSRGMEHTCRLAAVSCKYFGEDAIVLSLYDVSAQKRAEEKLQKIAVRDELTGLYNRHFLESMVNEEIQRAERYDIPLSVALIDLDFFKRVNDTWGHPVGDQILKFTAEIIRKSIRMSDYAVRIGGEEFLVMMSNTSIQGAEKVAEKIRKRVEETPHPVVGSFTASIGIAERNGGENYSRLYVRVDEALYEAKQSGRNRVMVAKSMGGESATVSLKWNSAWNCGEKMIDLQHKELFRSVTQLVSGSCAGEEQEDALHSMNEMIYHLRTHFQYEESVLVELGYKDVVEHRKLHLYMIRRAEEIKEALEQEEMSCYKAFARVFDEIIVGHLLTDDTKFFALFTKEEEEPQEEQ